MNKWFCSEPFYEHVVNLMQISYKCFYLRSKSYIFTNVIHAFKINTLHIKFFFSHKETRYINPWWSLRSTNQNGIWDIWRYSIETVVKKNNWPAFLMLQWEYFGNTHFCPVPVRSPHSKCIINFGTAPETYKTTIQDRS